MRYRKLFVFIHGLRKSTLVYYVETTIKYHRGIFRNLSNIYDGTLVKIV